MARFRRLSALLTSFMYMTKRSLMALAVVAATLTLQSPARAADATQPAPSTPGDRPAALRERMQETARELNLTHEQTVKLQSIVSEHAQNLRALRQDNSLSPEEKRQKLLAAREEIVSEVKKVLTPEQFEKWKARQGQTARGAVRPLARLQQAINDLNLTDEQKDQLKPLYQEQMEKLRDLYQDTSLSMAEKLDKLKSIHQEAAPKLRKVFNADQYAKWEKDVTQWLDQLKQHLPPQG
jgi:Spy/CpxP family protein refolding chaperone